MYIRSAADEATAQGRAIRRTTLLFGNGETLPFSPCKRGYIPLVVVDDKAGQEHGKGRKRKRKESHSPNQDQEHGKQPFVACSFHHEKRMARLKKESFLYRKGEMNLNVFWSLQNNNNEDHDDDVDTNNDENRICALAPPRTTKDEMEISTTNDKSSSKNNNKKKSR